MKRLVPSILSMLMLISAPPMLAQFNTPSVDGIISAGEYGIHTNGQNQETNASQTWFMTWDNTNLYLALTTANINEGAVLYIDKNPLIPINGGANADGTIVGQPYDNTDFAALPFRADFVTYFKSGYREYRTSNSSNGWTAASTGFGSYAENAGTNTRELAIPWSLLGGRPASFAWYSYATSGGGFVYGQVPVENAGGMIGVGARYARYYIVNGTNDGASVRPFSRNSYVFNSATDESTFGAITVYDFTMNSPGRTITRSTGAWTIGGALRIENGTISFGSVTDAASVAGDVTVASTGTITLSTAIGGDLNLGGNLVVNGTLTPNHRTITFDGTAPQIVTGGGVTFDYLAIDNDAGLVLTATTTVNDGLILTNGRILLGNISLILAVGATITGGSAASFVATTESGSLQLNGVGGSTDFVFPVGTSTTYNPVTINNSGTADNFAVRVQSSFDSTNPPNLADHVLTRQWTIVEAAPGGSNVTLTLQWNNTDSMGSQFNPVTNGVQIGRWTGTQWNGTTAVLRGTGPFTATASGFTEFSPFGVGNNAQGSLPVQLASFTGRRISEERVRLNWRTISELNNYGFYVQRRMDGLSDWETIQHSFVAGHGTTHEPRDYSYTDHTAIGLTIQYRLQQIDFDGTVHFSEPITVHSPTDVGEAVPREFALMQNYPNPFNPWTEIRFSVARTEKATLDVFNALGQKVATLFDGVAEAGYDHRVRFDAADLASGVYYYILRSGEQTAIRKLIVMK